MKIFFFACLFVLQIGNCFAQSTNTAIDLRTDYRINPIGIDRLPPKLSWRMNAVNHLSGAMQTAYQVQAATSVDGFATNKLIWDSRKVPSSSATQIAYAGIDLKSSQRIYWRVKLWDEKDKELAWSKPTWFETGLLSVTDWQNAAWIGSQQNMNEPQFAPADLMGPWITAQHDTMAKSFYTDFELPNKQVQSAVLYIGLSKDMKAANVIINDEIKNSERFANQAEGALDIAFQLKSGSSNRIEILYKKTTTNTALTAGMKIVFADGTEKIIQSSAAWNVKNNTPDSKPYSVNIAEAYGGNKYGVAQIFKRKILPPAWYRKRVEVNNGLVSARIYLSALGQGLAYVNGKQIDSVYYSSPQSDYETFGYYTSHDITKLLKTGDNALSILLDGGWYDQVGGFNVIFSYGRPGIKAIVNLKYANGSTQSIISDTSWQWKEGEIQSSNVYLGERIDYRKGHQEWQSLTENNGWKFAQLIPPCTPLLKSIDVNPVKPDGRILPIKTWKKGSQTWLYDFGVVKHGVIRLNFKEAKGQTIRIRYSEYAEDGQIWNAPLSNWWCHRQMQNDELIADGKAHTYQSFFATKSFRYFEVSGLTKEPNPNDIHLIPVHTQAEVLASFTSSDNMLNRLFDNGMRTFQNYMNHVTGDMPRERCLWGAESIYSTIPATYCFDFATNNRLMNTLWWTGPKTPSGMPGNIGVGKRLSTYTQSFIWSATPVFSTAEMNDFYGDAEPLNLYYDEVKKFLRYHEQTAKNGVIPIPNLLTDHAAQQGVPRNPVNNELICSMVFYKTEKLLEKMATDLGKTEDANHANIYAQKIKAAILNQYDSVKHTFGNGTHNSLALAYGIMNDKIEELALAKSLAAYYKTNGHKFDGGFMSYEIYPMLSKFGYVDDAYDMLVNPNYSGPAGSIKTYDATTFWEAYPQDKQLQMARGLNFIAFAHSIGWMITDLAGIRYAPNNPNGKKILLEPKIPKSGKLKHIEASLKTPTGLVKSSWKIEGQQVNWTFSIPANTTAEVTIPTHSKSSIQGVTASLKDTYDNNGFVFTAKPGTYNFRFNIDNK